MVAASESERKGGDRDGGRENSGGQNTFSVRAFISMQAVVALRKGL